MTEFISFHVKFEPEDTYRAIRFLRDQSILYRYNYLLLPIPIFGIIVLVVLSATYDKNSINWFGLMTFALLAAGVMGVGAYLSRKVFGQWYLRRKVRKMYAKSPNLGIMNHYLFTDDGFEINSELGAGKVKWEAYEKVTESEHDFFLFTAAGVNLFFPKRAFSSDADIDSLRSLFKERFGQKGKFKIF